MEILHYSDKGIDNFDELYGLCDVLLVTGDLTLFDFGNLRSQDKKKPAFGVYGNHCSGNYFETLGIVNLHNRVVEYHGLKWGGFQGCLKYKEGGIFYTEDDAREFAGNFPSVDILLLHAGPKGMLDDPSDIVHQGSESLHRYVVNKNPRFVFFGHQYSNAEMQFGETQLFRTYGARLIKIDI